MNVPDKIFQSHSWLDINIYMFVKRNTTDGVVKVSLQQIADEFGTTKGKIRHIMDRLYDESLLVHTKCARFPHEIRTKSARSEAENQEVMDVFRTKCARFPYEMRTNITAAFDGWLAQNCPYIYAHYKLLSGDELTKLKEQYSSWQIADTCRQIENRKDLRKKYTNLYMTLLNWLKRDENGTNRTDTEQRNAEAARNIAAFLADD